ncbi:MAG: transposase zinc-binding domain-containing protein [Elusimicrobia bacterium]|nr:transposase zinc-binding domain-containing protein [Elusimicrobiota bacterium]
MRSGKGLTQHPAFLCSGASSTAPLDCFKASQTVTDNPALLCSVNGGLKAVTHDRIHASYPHPCKRRGLCPSCDAKRAVVTVSNALDRLLPAVPYRQWVLVVPKRLRYFLYQRTATAAAPGLPLWRRRRRDGRNSVGLGPVGDRGLDATDESLWAYGAAPAD